MMSSKPAQQPAASKRPQRVMDMYAPGYVPTGLRPEVPKPVSQPRRRNLPLKRLFMIASMCIFVVMLIGIGIWLVLLANHSQQSATAVTKVTDTVYQVVDDPNGVKFNISKDFTPMSSDDLKKLNPHFMYGYQIANVNDVACIISQTANAKAVTLSEPQLVQGAFTQLKSNYPDVKPVWDQPLSLKNGQQAAELIVTYRADDGTEVKQVEVVAATKTRLTFAFCTSPVPLYTFYLPKFDSFFTELEVY